MAEGNSTEVHATVNSFRILEQLVGAERPVGVTELADAVDLSKGVVHNHLNTLSGLGYVKKHGQRYLPSLGLLKLGEDTRRRLSTFTWIRHYIENLARLTGEVSTLFVEEGGLGVCVYTALGSERWVPDYTCGSQMPLHVNAPGKAILASLDQDRIDDIIEEHGLTRMTTQTVTIPETLKSELRNIRENRISFCRGEQFPDVIGAAATIGLNERGPTAAIGVCGPSDRLSGRYLEEDLTGQVISTANSVQVELSK